MGIPVTTIKNSPIALRHELKYSIHAVQDYELALRLRKLFPHDKHADTHGSYRVCSLYFDTPYDKAYCEKLHGVNQREKFRLRYYKVDTSFIRLEKKMKINGLCAKRSTKVTKEEVEKILVGDYAFLLQKQNPLLLEFYSKLQGQQLRPKTMVVYDREAFLYEPGNVRITLDRNVRSGLNNLDFLKTGSYPMTISDGMTVLEVKYDSFLPEIVRMAVQIPNQHATAFSKYAICRKFD